LSLTLLSFKLFLFFLIGFFGLVLHSWWKISLEVTKYSR